MNFKTPYSETVQLENGEEITVRPIFPSDKPILQEGLKSLSRESTFQRFHAYKNRLSSNELNYLTELDGNCHFGIIAIKTETDGSVRGVGVARVIRNAKDLESGEGAVVIADEYQNMGLGTLMCDRLKECAAERGMVNVTGLVLHDNKRMFRIIEKLAHQFQRKLSEPNVYHVDSYIS